MIARFTLSPRAQADLDDIWNYTEANWNVAQAETYVRDLGRATERLASEPGLGKSCDEIRSGYFKFLCGSHVLFYRKTRNEIDVVRILHQRMDFDDHL